MEYWNDGMVGQNKGILEEWKGGRMEKPCYGLRVTGYKLRVNTLRLAREKGYRTLSG